MDKLTHEMEDNKEKSEKKGRGSDLELEMGAKRVPATPWLQISGCMQWSEDHRPSGSPRQDTGRVFSKPESAAKKEWGYR